MFSSTASFLSFNWGYEVFIFWFCNVFTTMFHTRVYLYIILTIICTFTFLQVLIKRRLDTSLFFRCINFSTLINCKFWLWYFRVLCVIFHSFCTTMKLLYWIIDLKVCLTGLNIFTESSALFCWQRSTAIF